jgi:hypothetical protein
MKKLALLLALTVAVPLVASKDKVKHKDKRFDPVAVTAEQAAGRYVGIDGEYVVELTATGAGTLQRKSGTLRLTNLVIDGSELRATAGGTPFSATFVNRTKNGETAFGLMVHHADIWLSEQMMISDLFCRRE